MRHIWLAATALLALTAGGVAAQKLKTPPGSPPPAAAAPPAAPARPALRPPRPDEPESLTRLRRLLGPEAALDYAEAREEGAQLRLTDAVLDLGGQRLRAAELRAEGVREDGAALLALRDIAAEGADAGAARVELRDLAVGPAVGRSLAALRTGAVLVGGLRLPLGGRLTIAEATLDQWGTGRASRIEATGWRLALPAGGPVEEATLAHARIMASDPMEIIGRIRGALANPDAPSLTTQGLLEASLERIELRGGGKRLGGVGAATLRSQAGADGVASGGFALREMELTADSPLQAFLEPLGYRDGLRGDLSFEATQDEGRRRMSVDSLAFAVREVAALGFSLTMEGVDSRTAMQADRSGVRLVAARLRFADISLLERWLAGEARKRGIAPAALRGEWVQQAAAALADPPRERGAMAPIREPVLRFLRGEARQIEAALAPVQPVGVELFNNPPRDAARWRSALGLTVTAR